jgi:hypothetical protein
MQEQTIGEITFDWKKFNYYYKGQLFNDVTPPGNWTYSSKTDYTLRYQDGLVAYVGKYEFIQFEPIPDAATCRQRMKALIDTIPDDDILYEYMRLVDTFGAFAE